jgi:hypothetical protein
MKFLWPRVKLVHGEIVRQSQTLHPITEPKTVGSFAVVVKDESGIRVPDQEVIAALGL